MTLVHRGLKVIPDHRVYKASKETPVPQALQVRKEILALRAFKVLKVTLETLDLLEQPDLKDLSV